MNLNPFVFTFKVYENCPMSTMVNSILSALQRVFAIMGIALTPILILGGVAKDSLLETIVADICAITLYLLFRFRKNKWTDKMSITERKKNNL